MSFPNKNPNSIVLRNEYYKSGLKELAIWNHYQKNKILILENVKNNPIIIFFATEVNKSIVIRNSKGKKIILNFANYDRIISGRTISIAVETEKILDEYIIDVDYPTNITENYKKQFLTKVLDFFKTLSEVKMFRVFLTSSGYHVHGQLDKKINYKIALNVLRKKLNFYFSKDDCTIDTKSSEKSKINLDLSPINRGAFTVPFALNRNGLICLDVTNNYLIFDRRQAVIKTEVQNV